ncbi:MAG: NAD(P)-binding domain-containing protein [Acidimicrobiales bacterium]
MMSATQEIQSREELHIMSSISIIGSGNMARAIGARAVKGGNEVEVSSRDAAKAETLARTLGGGTTAAKFGAGPVGEIVVLAVPYASAVPVVAHYGDALAGKVIVDITNPFNTEGTGLVTSDGTSIAQEIAKAAPASAHVVKAFNTIFGHVLAQDGRNMDALFAGDDAQAKASMSAFIASLGLRPLDAGGLEMARWLEGAGLLMVGLARNGVSNFDFTLGVSRA